METLKTNFVNPTREELEAIIANSPDTSMMTPEEANAVHKNILFAREALQCFYILPEIINAQLQDIRNNTAHASTLIMPPNKDQNLKSLKDKIVYFFSKLKNDKYAE